MLNESVIIESLRKHSQNRIGDDCTVLPHLENEQYLLTKDLLIEDVHFKTRYFSPKDLAHKSLHVNLSDIAAMGGKPQSILCGIAIPLALADYAELYLEHLIEACREANVILIGGDTTLSPTSLMISITAIGSINKHHIKHRNSANVNDVICLVGNAGHAHLGLTAFENDLNISSAFKDALLKPNAKVEEGQWLGNESAVTSMIDTSDGLYMDLKHLCDESNQGAMIQIDDLLSNQAYLEACDQLALDPIQTALCGGEDYALLITLKPEFATDVIARFRERFSTPITELGVITQSNELQFCYQTKLIRLTDKPYTHFGEAI